MRLSRMGLPFRRLSHTSATNLATMRNRASEGFNNQPSIPASQTCWVLGEKYSTEEVDHRRAAFDHQGFLVIKAAASFLKKKE